MLIKTVTTVVTTDSTGKPVDALPVREAVDGETDAAGRPVTPINVTEDPNGVPVRLVTTKAAQNSAGQWVDSIPVKGAGGVTPSVQPITLVAPYDAPAFMYSFVRLSSYPENGPCIDVKRASDGATMTLNFKDNVVDLAAGLAWANGSLMSMTRRYDLTGNGRHATETTNPPKFGSLHMGNGIPLSSFDGQNGAPLVTAQMSIANLVLDVTNLSFFMIGRQHLSQNLSEIISLQSSAPATIAEWRHFQGPTYIATSTQTQAIYPYTNMAFHGVSRGPTSGVSGAAGQTLYIGDKSFKRAATTGTGTSASAIIGNNLAGASRGNFEDAILMGYSSELSDATVTGVGGLKAALLAPFPTPIQEVFAETLVLKGTSIDQGTGTKENQDVIAQLEPALKKRVRTLNSGVFGSLFTPFLTAGRS